MGMLNEAETLELFSMLLRTGQVWQLQGHYGRTAQDLIHKGVLTISGEHGIAYRDN